MKYALAYCSGGLLGLVTSAEMKEITYNDGNKGVAFTGLQVCGGWIEGKGGDVGKKFFRAPGMPWSSRTPRVIAFLDGVEGEALEKHLQTLAPDLALATTRGWYTGEKVV